MSDIEWWIRAVAGFAVGWSLGSIIRALLRHWRERREMARQKRDAVERLGYDSDVVTGLLRERKRHGRRDDQRK